MINTVRTWTRKPSQVLNAATNQAERKQEIVREAKPRVGFFQSFFQMWETQADLVVRNINRDAN